MQEPTEDDDDEASISMENEGEDSNLNDTFVVRRKAAKRTLPWDLSVDELELVSPQQAEEIRATKRPRLEEPSSASTEAAGELSSHDTAVSLPPAAGAADDDDVDHADANPLKCTRATGPWAPEEDAKLNSAFMNSRKKKSGTEYKTDWAAVAALVPSRTTQQCLDRWRHALAPRIDRSNRRTSAWVEDEDMKLKDAVQTHCGNNWGAISALVPGRTIAQCRNRWRDALDPSVDREDGRTGTWVEDEDEKLKDAVQMHGGKNWGAIAALVPGRTRNQCYVRWNDHLDPSIDPTMVRAGKWTAVDDDKLKVAVQTHGGKDWAVIAALVPGRAKRQCRDRWRDVLHPNIDLANERTGKWSEDEDIKLKDAVQTHGRKNWGAIAALVPGRTNNQCRNRWHHFLDPSIDPTTVRAGKWTAVDDGKLKDAVQTHGGKDWPANAALVTGRSRKQCWSRWNDFLDPNIDRTPERTGKWSKDESSKLKDSVQTHGGKNWDAIAALVPFRTKEQCKNKWRADRKICYHVLDPNIDQSNERTGKWGEDEDIKLKDAAETHGRKNWSAIAALVPGRTHNQCRIRWNDHLDPSIDPTTARAGKWSAIEDKKLEDALLTHGGKDWAVIAALVPGRTRKQCWSRWNAFLDPSIDRTPERTGKWSKDEGSKLKDSVQTHGGKNWDAIAALVPGRTKELCKNKWRLVKRQRYGAEGCDANAR
jgi:antitoxin (DNA-binding transcriptional repressor) of toxin-antitoxin stability system